MNRREFIVATGAITAAAALPAAARAKIAAEESALSDAVVKVPLDRLYFLSVELAEGEKKPHLIGDRIIERHPVKLWNDGPDTRRMVVIREAEHFNISTCKRTVDYTLVPEELVS